MIALISVKCHYIVHRMMGEYIHKYKDHLWEDRKIIENNFR